MKKFDGIVCISQTSWQGDFQKAVVQLMTELSARHKVLYIDYQYTLKDWALGLAGRRSAPVRELVRLANPLSKKTVEGGKEVYVWTPPLMLPLNWLPNGAHDKLMQLNINRMIAGLRPVLRNLAINQPLVINAFNPVWGVPMLGKLNECATIYYCYDEVTLAGDWMSRHGGRYEQQYLPLVDACVTTSETLRRAKSVWQPSTFCVKNGANFDLFSLARQRAADRPPGKPTVGYLGAVDNRININLVEHCVQTMPDVTFQFIGRVDEPQVPTRLLAYPNVTFTPPRQPGELPALLANFSAAMIPFVCNEHTYTIYPLKINEYLAAGLPVVSTPFSLLDDFKEVIELAARPEEFAQALRRALADTSPARMQQRMEMARSNSWEERAKEFEQVIRRTPAAWSALQYS